MNPGPKKGVFARSMDQTVRSVVKKGLCWQSSTHGKCRPVLMDRRYTWPTGHVGAGLGWCARSKIRLGPSISCQAESGSILSARADAGVGSTRNVSGCLAPSRPIPDSQNVKDRERGAGACGSQVVFSYLSQLHPP
ncbi:hypothetical protein NL676_006000 [Syzygium grande]|nr:hypothetical protein NL676_006000 [Syzygium grande]